MSTKRPILGAILGFLILGIFYSGGLKRGAIACILLLTLDYVLLISFRESVLISFVSHFIGAYLGYAWAKQHNEQITQQG